MTHSLPGGSRNLPRLTSLRFFAALAVFLFHVGRLGIGWNPARLFEWGYTGVTFFFLLSGFVLAWSFGPHVRVYSFWRRRVARIVPVYVVVTVAAVPLLGLMGETFRPGVLSADLLFVQAWSPDTSIVYGLNRASWSLSVEAFFYATFPVVAMMLWHAPRRRRWIVACCSLLVAGGVAVGLSAAGHSDTAYTLPLVRLPEFMLGIVLAVEFRDGWRPRVSARWLAVAFVVAAVLATESPGKIGGYAVVLPGAALIIWAAEQDMSGRASWLVSPWALWLGQASFAFYLVHSLVLRVAVAEFGWDHDWPLLSGFAVTFAIFAVTLSVSAALHHGVERPMQKMIAGRSSRRSSEAHRDKRLTAEEQPRPAR
jgi:peptidoglycan/LPS O-acetylase OafA/YrhL